MASKPVAGTGGGRFGADKELEKVIKKAKKAGWTVSTTGGNHILFLHPDGESRVLSGLTGCGPGFSKVKGQLRNKGLHTI